MGHADGSKCMEGIQIVMKDFEPCCERFGLSTKSCSYEDLRFEWWEKRNSWLALLLDGSGIVIKYCPYCGKKL